VNPFFLKLLSLVNIHPYVPSSIDFDFISAQPSAEIIWDKDGNLIGDDSPFRIDYYGDGRATLYIPEVFADDQGYYTCTVTNTHGTYRTTSRLIVDCKFKRRFSF